MVTERIGVVNGSGTTVKLGTTGSFPSQDVRYGWVYVVAPFKKGNTDELHVIGASDSLADRVLGDADSTDERVFKARNFITNYVARGRGTGGILAVRVTDGNEVASSVDLYARKVKRTKVATLSAKNGGRWGGYSKRDTGDFSLAGDLTDETLDTGNTYVKDQWAGATLTLEDVPNVEFEVISNTTAGVLTVKSGSAMKTQYDALSGSSMRWHLKLEDTGGLTYKIDFDPTDITTFSIYFYEDGQLVTSYEDVSFDDASEDYWETVINDDDTNHWVTVNDTYVGDRSDTDLRPASYYSNFTSLTATSLTVTNYDYTINSPGDADPTVAVTTNAESVDETITLTFSDATTFTAVSNKFGSLGSAGTVGTTFEPNNDWSPDIDVTAGGTALSSGDTIVIQVKPLRKDEFKNAILYPNVDNDPTLKYLISGNTHNTINVQPSDDMATDTSGDSPDTLMIVGQRRFEGGIDGLADISDADYTKHFHLTDAIINEVYYDGYGVIKVVTPGYNSTSVDQAAQAFAEAKLYMHHRETPNTKTDEASIVAHHVTTLGRSRNVCALSATEVDIQDPYADRKLRKTSALGYHLGQSALVESLYGGYFAPAAGLDYPFPEFRKIATGKKNLDIEVLEPAGVNVLLNRDGWVYWGNNVLTKDPAYRDYSVRMQMMHWAHYLRENYEKYIFKPANIIVLSQMKSDLLLYFTQEYNKGSLDNNFPFEEVFTMTPDAEVNANTSVTGIVAIKIDVRPTNAIRQLSFELNRQGIVLS